MHHRNDPHCRSVPRWYLRAVARGAGGAAERCRVREGVGGAKSRGTGSALEEARGLGRGPADADERGAQHRSGFAAAVVPVLLRAHRWACRANCDEALGKVEICTLGFQAPIISI